MCSRFLLLFLPFKDTYIILLSPTSMRSPSFQRTLSYSITHSPINIRLPSVRPSRSCFVMLLVNMLCNSFERHNSTQTHKHGEVEMKISVRDFCSVLSQQLKQSHRFEKYSSPRSSGNRNHTIGVTSVRF